MGQKETKVVPRNEQYYTLIESRVHEFMLSKYNVEKIINERRQRYESFSQQVPLKIQEEDTLLMEQYKELNRLICTTIKEQYNYDAKKEEVVDYYLLHGTQDMMIRFTFYPCEFFKIGHLLKKYFKFYSSDFVTLFGEICGEIFGVKDVRYDLKYNSFRVYCNIDALQRINRELQAKRKADWEMVRSKLGLQIMTVRNQSIVTVVPSALTVPSVPSAPSTPSSSLSTTQVVPKVELIPMLDI